MTKLILFPYAGSLGLAYNQWMKSLRTKFDATRIVYTDLKEGKRNYECASWEELMELLFQKVSQIVTDDDYIFFGHSMGSRAAYEMYRRILKENMPLPKKIILSGCQSLEHMTTDPDLLTEEKFRKEYIELGGISDEVLACEELAELAFAELRKDVKLLSQFRYVKTSVKCPVTILNGELDKISTKEEWEELLGKEVEWKLYSGKHFFIYDHETEIVDKLLSYAR